MFKILFKEHISNRTWIKIFSLLTIVLIALELIFFFIISSFIPRIILLALMLFIISSNWIANVVVPRTRLRKNIDQKYLDSATKHKSKLVSKEYAEVYIYAYGLAFTTLSLMPLTISIIFVIF